MDILGVAVQKSSKQRNTTLKLILILPLVIKDRTAFLRGQVRQKTAKVSVGSKLIFRKKNTVVLEGG